MLRCVANSDRHLQAVPWQAAQLLQAVCLQQQLPIFGPLCQQQASQGSRVSIEASNRKQGQRYFLQQLLQHHEGPQQGGGQPPQQLAGHQQHSGSRSSKPYAEVMQHKPYKSSNLWQQIGLCSIPQLLQPTQHSLQQRPYSSMATGHAHYHARHSGKHAWRCVRACHRGHMQAHLLGP